jgi:hypothetical protein
MGEKIKWRDSKCNGRRERQREEKLKEVAIDITLNGRGTPEFKFKFTTTKVPRQCPLVLLVKVS